MKDEVDLELETNADLILEHLGRRGVEYFLANSGTDFPSIIEGFAKRKAAGLTKPKPLPVPHETTLVTMSHGYYLATGKPLASMVHVGIGTANALGPLMSASRAQIPLLLFAGKTPITEYGHPASRSLSIQWGQDCFDQGGIVREWVKWDYELRRPEELPGILDRALSIALSDPPGPVYLTMPRELLFDRPMAPGSV